MTIDPAPETDARPASEGGGSDDTEVTPVGDTAQLGHDTEVTEQPRPTEAAAPAPFDADAEPETRSEADTQVEAVPAEGRTAPAPPVAPVPAPTADADGAAAAPTATEPVASGRRRRPRRIKARQVQRVITRVDPWSMLKVSLLFALSMWLIVVVAGVLIWRVAVSTDTISNFENFLAQTLGEDTFTIDGSQIFQGSIVVGLVFFVTGAVFAVVTSVLFNLIAGLVGGVRFTMVELETARPVEEPTEAA